MEWRALVLWSRSLYDHVSRWKRTLPTGSRADLFLDYVLAWNHLRYPPNVFHPKTLNELFLNSKYDFKGDMSLARRVTDKFEFKNWLDETPERRPLIVPNLKVFDPSDRLEGRVFQNETILKPTHMSGAVVFFKNDRTLSSEELGKIRVWLDTDYHKRRSEPNYKGLRRRLIVEPMLRVETGRTAKTFGFFMIAGRPLMISYDLNRDGNFFDQQYYSPEWELLDISNRASPRHPVPIPRPAQLDAALDAAAALAGSFPLCRVDLYLLPEAVIKAGEITLFPFAGSNPYAPTGADRDLGRRARALMVR